MAVSHSDKYLLGQEPGFRNRVRAAMVGGSVGIRGESPTVVNYYSRQRRAVDILNQPDSYYVKFADAVACDSAVINAATVGGTVTLTAGNVATQAALVTDAQINASLGALFDAFVLPFA